MALNPLSILNDPTFTPLVVHDADPVYALDAATGEEFFIVVGTTLRIRRLEDEGGWLASPLRLVRGGGRP